MTKISILGCGWLGIPLAKTLVERGHQISGSTTSESKISMLRDSRIDPFVIALNENAITGNLSDFLQNSEILIIDIPPKLRSENSDSFVGKINALIPFIEKSTVEKVLFISSTSVYADDDSVVTEAKTPNPDSESGRQLVQTEQLLLQNKNFKSTVLRFAGLIGADRHPIKYLAGKENVENPEAPINLIHQDDCIGIICEIIGHEIWNETFNAAAPFHPTRLEYYTQKATELGLPLPKFNAQKTSLGKIIAFEKLQQVLNYEFRVPKL